MQLTAFVDIFAGAGPTSQQFAAHYRRVANAQGCAFLDTAAIIVSRPLDGIHVEANQHARLGLALAERVRVLLG